MAVGEKRNTNQISQVSWTDGTAMDVYYWLDHSFQYSSNINCDDELHWLKLSTKSHFTSSYSKCHLLSLWNYWVMALPVDTVHSSDEIALKRFQYKSANTGTAWFQEIDSKAWTSYAPNYDAVEWVVFQDRYWFGSNRNSQKNFWYLTSLPLNWSDATQHWFEDQKIYLPYDHPEATDESIEDKDNVLLPMKWKITAILNYNNTRLVVASGQEIWVYYPELDFLNPNCPNYDPNYTPVSDDYGKTWWKRVLTYEAWVVVVWLTCSFEYLKTWCVDEWWNTKVYYYQGNNNLRNTFVYNLVDLTWVRVVKVYNINWIDYYVSSLDGSDWFVNLYKLVWTTPVQLFKQRAWLDQLDVNFKAPYFVWPVGMSAAYSMWKFYIADAYGLFQFTYSPQWFDKWYMKWGLYNNKQVYWVCENKWWLYVSTQDWCYAMRVWDTWVDEYQEQWVLISREYEWKEWGTITKMLDEIRLNYELNPLTYDNGSIDIYVSPNNLWRTARMFDKWEVEELSDLPSANSCIAGDYYWVAEDNTYYLVRTVREEWIDHNEWWDVWDVIPWYKTVAWWFKVMHIEQKNGKTRTERSNLFNDLWAWKESAFKFDWQTITYAIVITRWEETKATPIVRQIDIRYHTKDKTNNVYDIN